MKSASSQVEGKRPFRRSDQFGVPIPAVARDSSPTVSYSEVEITGPARSLGLQFVDCDEADASVLKRVENLQTYTVYYTFSMLLKVTNFNTVTYIHT